MKLEHRGSQPQIAPSAYVAPSAVLSGDVQVGEEACVLHGAILTAQGGAIEIGARCVIMENAVLRGTPRHPLRLGECVLVGPRAALTGCLVDDCAFLATGVTVFNGAHIGAGAEVRINGVVHLRSRLLPGALVPIGWVAVGDPARILPPEEHEEIWKHQEPLGFPTEVFGVERSADAQAMQREIMQRYTRALRAHRDDRELTRPRDPLRER